MAFTQSIDTPSVASGPSSTASGASGAADVSRIKGLENLVNLLGGAATAIAADSRRIKADDVTGAAKGAIMALDDERNFMKQQEQRVADETATIYADGDITPEEKSTLDSLEQQRLMLRQARDSGVLSQTGYSTRLNALYRSATADANNLGIQSQIGDLFLAARSTAAAPAVNQDMTRLTAMGDSYFGKGQWTMNQLADLAAKQQKAALTMRSIESATSDHLAGINLAFDTALRGAMRPMLDGASVESGGMIITEEERANISNVLNEQLREYNKILALSTDALRATGSYTKEHSTRLLELQKNARDLADSYIKMLNDPDTVAGGQDLNTALKRASENMDNMNNLTASTMIKGMKMGNGQSIFGQAGPLVAHKYADPNDRDAKSLWKYLSDLSGGEFTPEEVRQQQLSIMFNMGAGVIGIKEAYEKKGMSGDLYRLLTLDVSKQPATTPEEVDKILELRDMGVSRGDSENNISNLVTLSRGYETARESAVRNGRESQWKAQVTNDIKAHIIELQTVLDASPELTIKAHKDGTFDISVDSRLEPNEIPASTKRKLRIAEDHAASVSGYLGKALKAGDYSQVDLLKSFEEIDAVSSSDSTKTPTVRQQQLDTDARVSSIQPEAAPSQFGLPAEVTESVDVDLATAIQLESSGKIDAVNSGSGAAGILQLIPDRAKEEGIDPMDPNASIRAFKEHAKTILPVLESQGLEANGFTQYLTWQQGRAGGIDILRNQDKLLGELSKARQTNMLSNEPPKSRLWSAISDKSKVPVEVWVDEWRKHYERTLSEVTK